MISTLSGIFLHYRLDDSTGMKMTLTIRTATPSDAALLNEMGYASYRAQFEHLWESREELENYLHDQYSISAIQKSLHDPADRWLIAAADGPVGFAKLHWQSAVPAEELTGALLSKIYLLPDRVGQGYGEALFKTAIAEAKERGETFLWLEVLENNPRARKFYQSHGMRHIKDVVFSSATQSSTVHILGMGV